MPAGQATRLVPRIDERNGIELDAWWIDGALYSRFAVGTSDILATYRMTDGGLAVDLVTSSVHSHRVAGGKDRVPEVADYRVRAVQRALLARR